MRLLIAILGSSLAACSLLFEPGETGNGNHEIDFSEDGDYLLDTDLSLLTLPSNRQIKLQGRIESTVLTVQLQSFHLGVNSRLVATGVNALELQLTTPVQIDGIIDLAAYPEGPLPAGSGNNRTSCGGDSIDAPELGTASGAGGGAGASFQSNAGRGGGGGGPDVELDEDGESLGDPQGGQTPTIDPWAGELRGGCPGGRGARALSDASEGQALGGLGGGGIHIVSTDSITIAGQIYASGAGGQGGSGGGGGGGGGSGGVIWLSAPQIAITATGALRANGGGGGEGSSGCQDGSPGQDGSDGSSTALVPPAQGGTSPTADRFCTSEPEFVDPAGGDGGDGSFGKFGNPGDGANGEASEGGGGGGGSDGYIILQADAPPSYQEEAIDPWPSDVCGELLDPTMPPSAPTCS